MSRVKIHAINSYMNEKKMNVHLQMKVRKYLEYMFHENNEQTKSILFDSLSHKLKEEVQIDIYCRHLNANKFFKNNFSENFLKKLSLEFQEFTFAPEEAIFSVLVFCKLLKFVIIRKMSMMKREFILF